MALDLPDLETELTRMRRKASEWSTERMRSAADRKDQHVAFMRDQTDKLDNLRALKSQLGFAAEQTKQRLHNEEVELRGAQEVMSTVRANTQAAEGLAKQEAEQLQACKDELQRHMADLEAQRAEQLQELEYNRIKATKYSKYFGLRILPSNGEARFVFTQIDARDPANEFVLGIRYSDSYTVTTCEPRLPELEELTAKLNRENEMKAFIKAIRAGFVQLARQSHAA